MARGIQVFIIAVIRSVASVSLMLAIISLCICCTSGPTPIIIRPLPTLEMDVTSDEAYIRASSANVVKLGAYIEELINQCIHKVPTIDLRKAEVKD